MWTKYYIYYNTNVKAQNLLIANLQHIDLQIIYNTEKNELIIINDLSNIKNEYRDNNNYHPYMRNDPCSRWKLFGDQFYNFEIIINIPDIINNIS